MTNQRVSGAAGSAMAGAMRVSRFPEPRNTQHVNQGETGRDGSGYSCFRNGVKSPAPPTRVGTIFLLAGATANACSDLPLMLARLADVEVRQETVPPEDGGSQARYGDWSSPGPDEGQQRTGWRGHPGKSSCAGGRQVVISIWGRPESHHGPKRIRQHPVVSPPTRRLPVGRRASSGVA